MAADRIVWSDMGVSLRTRGELLVRRGPEGEVAFPASAAEKVLSLLGTAMFCHEGMEVRFGDAWSLLIEQDHFVFRAEDEIRFDRYALCGLPSVMPDGPADLAEQLFGARRLVGA